MADSKLKISNDNRKAEGREVEAVSECLSVLEDMQRKLDFMRIRLAQIQRQGTRG
ncbi:MAG: hypothetical protein ACRBBN_10820 [Methyloligellaceae bacterium]